MIININVILIKLIIVVIQKYIYIDKIALSNVNVVVVIK